MVLAAAIILIAVVSGYGYPLQPIPDFQYRGNRHSGETVQRALGIVEPLVPEAIRQAEAYLERRLDLERLDLFLEDIPTSGGRITPKMRVQGVAHPILIVFVEVCLLKWNVIYVVLVERNIFFVNSSGLLGLHIFLLLG